MVPQEAQAWEGGRPPTCPLTGSICCRVASTKTAVLPIPDLAWHRTSMPRMAWGIHSCWTEGERAHVSNWKSDAPCVGPSPGG